MATKYLKYNDPIQIIWRSGDVNDSYVDVVQQLKIVNGRFPLVEIPDEFNRVLVSTYKEIINDPYVELKQPLDDEFFVDYSNGIVYFNPSQESKTVTVTYKGRGQIMYPAERIYVHSPNPYAVENLQEFIELATLKLQEIDQAITDSRAATEDSIAATTDSRAATADSRVATQEARDATQDAIDAKDSTIMLYQEPANTYDEIATKYPSPLNGWRVMVKSTGDIYRYDGFLNQWELIENWTGGSVPISTDTNDGLMSKEDYTYVHNVLSKRTFGFVLPSVAQPGIQNYLLRIPFSGTITRVYAYCNIPADTGQTEISVEKIAEANFGTVTPWTPIITPSLLFDVGRYTSPDPTVSSSLFNVGDYFRLNFIQYDGAIKGITVQIDALV